MNYVVLLYQDPATLNAEGPEWEKEYAEYGAFSEAIQAAGQFVDGAPVSPVPDENRVVRVRDGKTEVMHGQAPHRPEALVGYYKLKCDSVDQAAALAAKIPAARKGFIEIVPEREM